MLNSNGNDGKRTVEIPTVSSVEIPASSKDNVSMESKENGTTVKVNKEEEKNMEQKPITVATAGSAPSANINVTKEAPKKDVLETTGEPREYSTGAHRDSDNGKGRCDLIPWRTLSLMSSTDADDMLQYNIEHQFAVITTAVQTIFTAGVGVKSTLKTEEYDTAKRVLKAVKAALTLFEKDIDVTWQGLMLESSYQYKAGAEKYGENNWKKGMPLWVYLDSGLRHYLKFKQGDTDEHHDRAFIWNMLSFVWAFDYQYNVGNALYKLEAEQ